MKCVAKYTYRLRSGQSDQLLFEMCILFIVVLHTTIQHTNTFTSIMILLTIK